MKRLKRKVADKCKDMGLSESAIEALINSMGANINDDSTDDEVESCATTIAEVAKTMQGEATRWANSAKEKAAKKKQAAKKTSKDDDGDDGDDGGGDSDLEAAITKAITAAIQPIADRIAKVEGAAITGTRRSLVEKELEGAPAMVKKLALANFDSKTFEKDEDFNTFLESVKADMADYRKEVNADTMRRQQSPIFGKTNEDGVSEAVAAYVKKSTEADGLGGKKIQ